MRFSKNSALSAGSVAGLPKDLKTVLDARYAGNKLK